MSVHLRTPRAVVALVLGLTLALAACGGGSDDTASSDGGKGTAATAPDTDTGSIPALDGGTHQFDAVDGSKARFINLLAKDGEGVGIDVYWGANAETGKKAATVAYGEVSDWETFQVDQDSFLTRTDGKEEVVVTFYPEGETERPIIQQAEPIEGDMRLTYTMGTGDGIGLSADQYPGSLGVGFDHEAGDPPAGKAWVAFNGSGLGGIDDGDFMVLSTADGCNDLEGTDIEGGTANSGQAYLVDVGTQSFTASDANTECAERLDPVDIDFAEGDQYVVYAYGTSLDDRRLMAVKVGE
ncbi:MAG TPA: hypothetical protein VNQ33_05095 [Acidimicrobiales bacterium]|nr:hypothetical protein [Acidimicrobiales bacterium]